MIGQCPIICVLLPFPIFSEHIFKVFIDTQYLARAMYPNTLFLYFNSQMGPIAYINLNVKDQNGPQFFGQWTLTFVLKEFNHNIADYISSLDRC